QAHILVNFLKVSGGKHDLAANTRQRLRDVRCDATSFTAHALQNLLYVSRVFLAGFLALTPIQTAIIVCQRRDVHPRLLASSAWSIKLVWADVNQRVCVPVISVL